MKNTRFIFLIKNYVLLIICGATVLVASGFYLYLRNKRKKFESFCQSQGLHQEITEYVKSKDKKHTKEIKKIIYPKFIKKKNEILIKNYSYQVFVENVNDRIHAYNRFFKTVFIRADLNENYDIKLIKSLMPEIFNVDQVLYDQTAKIGIDDSNNYHQFDFRNGIRAYYSAPSGYGKTSMIEATIQQLGASKEIFILAPRDSFKFKEKKYFDSTSVEDVRRFIDEFESTKLKIRLIKDQMRTKNIPDENFVEFVSENKIDFPYKVFILDDCSTYLRSSLYSKNDEMKSLADRLSIEFNKALREFRVYKFALFVVTHSPLVEEIDLSFNNFSHRFYNRVTNDSQSRAVTGNASTLISNRLKKGCWYLITEDFRGYIRTPLWKGK